jgi:hypothetical protein
MECFPFDKVAVKKKENERLANEKPNDAKPGMELRGGSLASRRVPASHGCGHTRYPPFPDPWSLDKESKSDPFDRKRKVFPTGFEYLKPRWDSAGLAIQGRDEGLLTSTPPIIFFPGGPWTYQKGENENGVREEARVKTDNHLPKKSNEEMSPLPRSTFILSSS